MPHPSPAPAHCMTHPSLPTQSHTVSSFPVAAAACSAGRGQDITKGRRRDQGAVKISCARQDPNARNCHGYRKFVKKSLLEDPQVRWWEQGRGGPGRPPLGIARTVSSGTGGMGDPSMGAAQISAVAGQLPSGGARPSFALSFL